VLKRLDHVGVVVSSLEDGTRLLRDELNLEPDGAQDRPDLRIAFFRSGDARVELIEPLGEARETRLGDAQARIEHISFEVEDLEQTLAALAALGIEVAAPPRESGGNLNVWTVPATSGGIALQFQQPL
jgi:catechol 2,3-dioxygenase-like lactoylglutathione lyase family enzyme